MEAIKIPKFLTWEEGGHTGEKSNYATALLMPQIQKGTKKTVEAMKIPKFLTWEYGGPIREEPQLVIYPTAQKFGNISKLDKISKFANFPPQKNYIAFKKYGFGLYFCSQVHASATNKH